MDQELPPKINFRPLTEGLGFHPFSDGLPYAPNSQNTRVTGSPPPPLPSLTQPSKPANTMGAGAMTAGPPKMALPPVQSQIALRPPLQPSPTSQSPMELPIAWDFAYCLRRMISYFIDLVLNTLLFLSAVIGLIWQQDSSPDLFSNSSVILVAVSAWMTFHWLFTTLEEVIFKSTVGKRAMGLSLRGSRGLILIRAVLFIPTIAPLGLGVLWGLIDTQKRCWHDMVVGIQPTELS